MPLPGPALLFCPGDRPERFAKAAAAADAVIVDLEDGVARERRDAARRAVRDTELDPTTTIVRISPLTSDDAARDLEMLRDTPLRTIMLAKTSSADEVRQLADYSVIALCETPAGVAAAEEIAACRNVVGMMWGAEDLVAALGGYSSRHADGSYRDVARYARARVLLAAGVHGRAALDAVYLDLDDLEGQRREASDAAALGFYGTVCLHPRQVAVVREAYRPTPEQITWATMILDATAERDGAQRVAGLMVDEPVLAQARQILRRRDAQPASQTSTQTRK